MRMKQKLTAATLCALALSFNALANVVYDNEVTNDWFKVIAKDADLNGDTKWTKPTYGEAKVENEKIKLDTDLTDPLIYTPGGQCGDVAIVTASFEATANTAAPDLGDNVPQAALTVVVDGANTNWYGLVKGETANEWMKFTNVIPTVGTPYDIKIEFDLRSGEPKRIRYSVGGTVLGDGWYNNPQSSATAIQSVSFSGTGDIGDFRGDNVVKSGASFNGENYETFEAALDAAKPTWASGTVPVVLYKDANYSASATETLYVDANSHTFTINGSVAVDQSGNTYAITASGECEAKIGDKYYSTIENAIAAADGTAPIVVNKAITRDLTIAKNLTINPAGLLTCGTLVVNAGNMLTLAGAQTVTTATINGSVAGAALTVIGTLTGVNVETLVFGDSATFAYAGAPLEATTLTVGSTLSISGLGSVALGDVIISNIGSYEAAKFAVSGTMPDELMLGKEGSALKVVARPPDVVVELDDDTAGYDFTNGTVNVKVTTVESGKSGSVVLKYIDFSTGDERTLVSQSVTATGDISWDLSGLVPGGAYSYTVEVKDSTGKLIDTKYGTFTAANWATNVWFGADAATGSDVSKNGTWEGGLAPTIEQGAYVIDDKAKFNVTETSDGSNRLTRVDAEVVFEAMVDGNSLSVESGALGGFVAATKSSENVWMALTTENSEAAWVALSGAVAPVAGTPYVVRAEISFLTDKKKVRYLVKEDVDGAEFCVLKKGSSEWLPLADASKTTLAAVEMNGSGKLAKLEATIADKAVAVVNGEEYDSMDDALAAARTAGKPIQLLTNATIDPNLNQKARYEILAGDYSSVSGGKVSHGDRTIFIPGGGEPPLVRPSEAVMQAVTAPGLTKPMNTDKLRTFLEKNGVKAYTENENATATDISNALKTSDTKNGLVYWQDYALGIDVGTSVAPVTTPAGDKDTANITLAIPAIDTTQYSGDYTINYQVMKGTDINPVKTVGDPSAILIPLNKSTGTYTIKAVFTAK